MENNIWQALANRDLATLTAILESEPHINRLSDLHGFSVLARATDQFPQAVPLLIEFGCDVNGEVSNSEIETNNNIARPLIWANDFEHMKMDDAGACLEATMALLKAGANPNLANNRGETALHAVAEGGMTSPTTVSRVTELLLEYGADINQQGMFGETPLDIAYLLGTRPVARILHNAGAKLAYVDVDPATALGNAITFATLIGDLPRLESLLASPEVDLDIVNSQGGTALGMAAYCGDADIVRFLLSRGADVNRRFDAQIFGKVYPGKGMTPLHVAAYAGHPEIIRLLIEANADIHAPGTIVEENTPLMQAILGMIFNQRSKADAYASIRLLIDSGADVRRRNSIPPISESGLYDEDADDTSPSSSTALMHLFSMGRHPDHMDLPLKMLLDAGAVAERSDLYETVAVTHNGHPHYLRLLWEIGRRLLNPPITLAELIPFMDGSALRFLLTDESTADLTIDVNEPDPMTGETALAKVRELVDVPKPWFEEEVAYEDRDVDLLIEKGGR